MLKRSIPPKYLIVLLGALVAFGPLSIDMYLPSLPTIAEDLDTNIGQVQNTITIFLVSFSIGMLIYGPLSDRFGRRKLLLAGMLIYIIATVGCILSIQIEQLQFFRLLQAIGGASASVLSRAMVRDLYKHEEIPHILAMMHLVTMVATLIAPVLGASIVSYLNWQSVFGFLLIYSILCLVWTYFCIHPPKLEPNPVSILNNYKHVLGNRNAVGLILCLGFGFGGMFAYITASSFIFIEYHGFSVFEYAILFASNIISIIAFTLINSKLLKQYSAPQLLKLFASISAIAGIYLAVIATFELNSAVLLIIGLLVYVGATGPLGTNTVASLLQKLPKQAGTASGLAVSAQFAFGALMSYLTALFFSIEHPISMNWVLCLSGTLSLLSITFIYKTPPNALTKP